MFGRRGVWGGGAGLDRECMESVTAVFFLFFSFFWGKGPGTPWISKQYLQWLFWCFYKKYHVYNLRFRLTLFFLWDCFFFRGCHLATLYNLLIFAFAMYFFSFFILLCTFSHLLIYGVLFRDIFVYKLLWDVIFNFCYFILGEIAY